MDIKENRVGILTYAIRLENNTGEILEEAPKDQPRTMLFGTGRLLKSFENKLLGLRSGDQFEFTLSPEECFGPYKEELLMDIPKAAFMVNGQIKEGALEIGRIVPMMDSEGNPFDGKVIAIEGDVVSMDFNHPLAGKPLYTKGEILNVREATYEELNPVVSGCGCGTPNDSCCGGGGHDHHQHDDAEGCGVCGDGDGHAHHHHHGHGGCNC